MAGDSRTIAELIRRPLRLQADNFADYMWGGDWIPRMKGLPVPNAPVAESWEFSGHKERPSLVYLANGASVPLTTLIEKFPAEILGESLARTRPARVPILLKFIDSKDDLSLQVHPPADYAARVEHDSGKAESWIILETGRETGEGFIYIGFNPDKAASYADAASFEESFLSAIQQANSLGPSVDPAVREKAERRDPAGEFAGPVGRSGGARKSGAPRAAVSQ
jgi:mannose-6-phosphate isomerase class I